MTQVICALRRLSVVFLSLFFIHCSTSIPSKAIEYFESCQEDAGIELLKGKEVKDKDILLFDLALLSFAVHSDETRLGIRHGSRALSNMWTLGDEKRGKLSMASSEAARDYKGEPFEKTMAGIYLGAIFFNIGDYQNARAAFQKAVLASETKSDKTKNEKVPLAHFLLAKTFDILGQEDNAKISLEKAQKYSDVMQSLRPKDLSSIHTIVVVETGQAPRKVRTGPGNSLITYQHDYSPFLGANLYNNGNLIGGTKVVEDLYVHAKENERGKKEALQGTKGAIRDASTVVAVGAADNDNGGVALVAGILALANQSQADTRQWSLLPARLHITWDASKLYEGKNDYKLQFLTNSRRIDPLVQQNWTDERTASEPKIYIKKARHCYQQTKDKEK
ncbi:MAG: hypothetical protein KDK51_02520 [Deltaproteobacteria bacterium]|nr:hypothetical protein [Deltaproteobacteria bacterium]